MIGNSMGGIVAANVAINAPRSECANSSRSAGSERTCSRPVPAKGSGC